MCKQQTKSILTKYEKISCLKVYLSSNFHKKSNISLNAQWVYIYQCYNYIANGG